MENLGLKNPKADLSQHGLAGHVIANWNLTASQLIEAAVKAKQSCLNSTGALVVDTGQFTGRSPKDRYIVQDDSTKDVYWGDVNIPISSENFDALHKKVMAHLSNQEEVYVRDSYACADPNHALKIRVVTEHSWQNLFAYNMFLRPNRNEIETFEPDWHIFAASGCVGEKGEKGDGLRIDGNGNFAIINFTKKVIIIGGTAYTGEIKKGIFSVLNYLLPKTGILPMHCSANVGNEGDTALFFGLSGTGKTTLSADPNRLLIGDDEHGWSNDSVFNFEGGCYAKCIDLSAEKEPDIFNAIRFGAMLENIMFDENDPRTVDYANVSKTQNTRVSYPIHHINNLQPNSMAKPPKNIFFLTCDAFGILPPISKLTVNQAMYYFISGYTAKVAGTEVGVVEPQATFSPCFGEPFLPLNPLNYADLLGQKLANDASINVWLVNTGWNGTGKRISLKDTRAMITAALNGDLNEVSYITDEIFKLEMPTSCLGVKDATILNPRNTWNDKDAYDAKANYLANLFIKNFNKRFKSEASEAILSAAPCPKGSVELING